MEIKKVCVLGAGTMGHGIAQVCAQAGCQVKMRARRETSIKGGMEKIQRFLKSGVERKKMSQEEADAILSRIKTTTDLKEAAEDADLVIEAATEDLEAKQAVFTELEDICPQHTIFATNTSYLCVTEIASKTKRPDKFLGTHWFNPPQLMRGVEIISTAKTSPEVVEAVIDFCKKLGKEPLRCKDSPGFIANRVLQPWVNESMKMLDEGIASVPDIDTAFKAAYNFRMGPLQVRDFGGLDVSLGGTETIYKELGTDIFRPARAHIMRVRAGDFGRKTGRGFYDYEKK